MWRTRNRVCIRAATATAVWQRSTQRRSPYTECSIRNSNRPKRRSANWKLIAFVHFWTRARVFQPDFSKRQHSITICTFYFQPFHWKIAYDANNCIASADLFTIFSLLAFVLGIGQIHFHNIDFWWRNWKQQKKNVKQKQQSSSEGANVEVEPNERSIERLNIEKKARAASSLPTMRHQTAAYAYHFTFVAAHLGRYQQMPKEIPWILHCSCWREECEKQLSHSFCICDAFIPSSLMFVSSSSPDRTKIYIQISLLSFTNSFTLMKMWQKLLQPTYDDYCGPAWIISTFSGANECFIWTSPITVRLWSFSWKLVRCRDHLKMPTAIRLQWLGWRIVENQTEDSVFGERFAAAAGATTPHAQTTEMKTNKNIDKKSNKNSGETNFSVRLTGCSQAAAATRTEPGFLLTINFVCAVRAIISLFTTHFLLRFFRLIVDVHTSPGLLRWDTYAAASQTNKMFTNERTRGVFMLLDDGIHTT